MFMFSVFGGYFKIDIQFIPSPRNHWNCNCLHLVIGEHSKIEKLEPVIKKNTKKFLEISTHVSHFAESM